MKHFLLAGAMIGLFLSCETSDIESLEEQQQKEVVEVSQKNRESFYSDLAYHHAPIHYQDVDKSGSHGLNGKGDYIIAYDFDGDLNATNNWNNLQYSQAKAVGYYGVVETTTHYFITYGIFPCKRLDR